MAPWLTPPGVTDSTTLRWSPLLVSEPMPGSLRLGREGLALQNTWELSPLLDDGLAWHGGSRLQLETVSSPLALGHFCQTPHCPPCIGRAWGWSDWAFRKEERRLRIWDTTACPSGVVRLSFSTWRYHGNPWKSPESGREQTMLDSPSQDSLTYLLLKNTDCLKR